ncbi:antitoxin [Streptomyces sp. NPDC004065]|uniref:antitoxin n=1 Tax=Streptomyces sp. NPDC004065 TaxID=3364689 RepID=UPI00384FB0B9
MSMMDKLKGLLKGHEHQAEKGVDRGGDYVDERTQGKYTGQVDTAQERAKDQLGGTDRGQDQPPR